MTDAREKIDKELREAIHAALVSVRLRGENLVEVMVRNQVANDIIKSMKILGYRPIPELTLISDEEIAQAHNNAFFKFKELLYEHKVFGSDKEAYCDRAIAQHQLAADKKAWEGNSDVLPA